MYLMGYLNDSKIFASDLYLASANINKFLNFEWSSSGFPVRFHSFLSFLSCNQAFLSQRTFQFRSWYTQYLDTWSHRKTWNNSIQAASTTNQFTVEAVRLHVFKTCPSLFWIEYLQVLEIKNLSRRCQY